jgi:hypothetical protein
MCRQAAACGAVDNPCLIASDACRENRVCSFCGLQRQERVGAYSDRKGSDDVQGLNHAADAT